MQELFTALSNVLTPLAHVFGTLVYAAVTLGLLAVVLWVAIMLYDEYVVIPRLRREWSKRSVPQDPGPKA